MSRRVIVVIPFHGQGHLFPCTELCLRLADRNYKINLILPTFSFVSTSLVNHPLIQITPLPPPLQEQGGPPEHHPPLPLASESLAPLLSPPPACAIVDVMMSWVLDIFQDSNIPTFSFFTSGAASAAMEYAVWKLRPHLKPGQLLKLPNLPDDVSLTFSDLIQPPPPNHSPLPPHPNFPTGGPPPPPRPGDHGSRPPPWIAETEGSTALLMNTCDDLERPFLEYVANVTGKPVWGVGPLLPAHYWGAAAAAEDSIVLHDREVRSSPSKRESNVTEEEVSEWLDRQPRGSVVYVAFGTEVGPSRTELEELAGALEESNRPFIWAIQSGPGSLPPPPPPLLDGHGHGHGHGHRDVLEEEEEEESIEEMARRVEGRGLLIRGWAPQLMILSHPSTGGFVSHCGWNSTMEALGRGVPLLAWPIRGDQHYNAKLVSSHLKVGLMVRAADGATAVKKVDIVAGIEKLMSDDDYDETRNQAASIRCIFSNGFPSSSSASLDAFADFLSQHAL